MNDSADSFHKVSYSSDWEPWLTATVPHGWNTEVRQRLRSNLKHILVGLEMKAALITSQKEARAADRSILYEPYFQMITFEFCLGTFSVCEGLGAAHHLANTGNDANGNVYVKRWRPALCERFDPEGAFDLSDNVDRVKEVRDKLHQDALGARHQIDWHNFGYEEAYLPAVRALRCILAVNSEKLPNNTNLVETNSA